MEKFVCPNCLVSEHLETKTDNTQPYEVEWYCTACEDEGIYYKEQH